MQENLLWYDMYRTRFKNYLRKRIYYMDTQQEKKVGLKIIIGLLIITLIAFIFLKFKDNNLPPEGNPITTTTGATETTQNTTPIDRKKYNDGTYTATGNYISPAGTEEIVITLTLKDDVITKGIFEGKAIHPTSKKMQGLFSEGFVTAITGKDMNTFSLTVVNGSSLTSKGFKDALIKIKTEALI